MFRAVAWWVAAGLRYRVTGKAGGQGHGAGRALTGDSGLLAGIARVAGVARVEHLLGAGQVLVGLLRHPWKAGRGGGYQQCLPMPSRPSSR